MEFFRGLFRRKPKRVVLKECLDVAYLHLRNELKWYIKYWKMSIMEFFRVLFRRKPKRVRVKPDDYETYLADLENCLVGAYPRPRNELKWSIKYWKACLGPIIPHDSLGAIPPAVRDYGGAVKVYKEALCRDIPWEEVCGYVKPKFNPNFIQ